MAFDETEMSEARMVIGFEDASGQATAEAQIDAFIANQIQSHRITSDSYSIKAVEIDGSGGSNQYRMVARLMMIPEQNTVIPALWAALKSAVNSMDNVILCDFEFRGRFAAELPAPIPPEP